MGKSIAISSFLLLLVCYSAGCRLGKVEIEYVFPVGFHGPAVIRERQQDGTAPCRVPYLPGTYHCVLEFPGDGVLKIRGESPGRDWHNASAKYADGNPIQVPDRLRGIIVSKGNTAVWAYGSIQNGEDWLFVGTEDEFHDFKQEKQANN